MNFERAPRKPNGIPVHSRPTSFRRRRVAISFFAIIALVLFFVPWELPQSLKDTDFPSALSRANIAKLVRPGRVKVDESHQLLYFVTSSAGQQLSHDEKHNPSKPLDASVYSGGEKIDWELTVRELDEKHPVIVFSKTYCPFSRKAKSLLESYHLSPAPKIVEVDLRDDGDILKILLTRLTKRSTFPNVMVKGKSIGGSDDLQAMHADGSLQALLEEAGLEVRRDVISK